MLSGDRVVGVLSERRISGLEVTTSLDLPIQEMAEAVVRQEVEKIKRLNVGNGGAMVLF